MLRCTKTPKYTPVGVAVLIDCFAVNVSFLEDELPEFNDRQYRQGTDVLEIDGSAFPSQAPSGIVYWLHIVKFL